MTIRELYRIWELVILDATEREEFALNVEAPCPVIIESAGRLFPGHGWNIDGDFNSLKSLSDPFDRRLNIRFAGDDEDTIAVSLEGIGNHLDRDIDIRLLLLGD
jgi:hypothetical protein